MENQNPVQAPLAAADEHPNLAGVFAAAAIAQEGLSAQEAYKVAVKMHMFQHQRWNQWCLFFFGSIAGIFGLWSQVKDIIPLVVACAIAFVLSVFWVFAALGIRAQNQIWEEILLAMETSQGQVLLPHNELRNRRDTYSILREFGRVFDLLSPETCFSISRLLIFLGVISSMGFLLLSVRSCGYDPKQFSKHSRSTTITTTTTCE